MTQKKENPLKVGPVRRWQRIKDPFRDAYLLAGRAFPVFNDLFIRLSEGKPDPWTYLVYSEGHTGTTALEYSLRNSGVAPVFRSHMLHPERLKVEPHYPKGISAMYYRHFIRGRRPLRVFSMVRNPLDQAVGRFFQHLRRFYSAEMSTGRLLELFHLFYQEPPPDWISLELNPVLGLDVYALPFDRDKGCLEIDGDWFKLLLMKLELDNSKKEQAVSCVLGRDDFRWDGSINASRNNVYAKHYKYFKDHAVIDPGIQERLLALKYVRHFYSEAEIESFREYWSNPRI